jgi:hypothetical protein
VARSPPRAAPPASWAVSAWCFWALLLPSKRLPCGLRLGERGR